MIDRFGRFGGNIFGPELGGGLCRFKQTYRCYSVTMLDNREDVERGGEIIMPPSALDQLTRSRIQYPMQFKLRNNQQARHTHCGVLEFVANEGRIYIPNWMMRNLLLNEGDLVEVENVSLKVATFTKFQPQSVDFLDIRYPEAVLGNMLRSFACLTKGDVISIKYNEREYKLCVLETKPDDAISVTECDLDVDFAPPVGYQEPKRPEKKEAEDVHMDFGRFGGNILGTELTGGLGECKQTYTCYSMIMLNHREDVDMLERGGKIIMPPSAVDQLIRLHIEYPMLFKLRNNQQARHTHSGVLEFVAKEDRIYIPTWMMRNLLLNDGDTVEVENVLLKQATFTKFQPQCVDFLDIINPVDVLGNMLRSFACLTRGDVISIKYNERDYKLCVLETKPDDAVSIIECDINVDFAPPVGYQEPKRLEKKHDENVDMDVCIT
ncbi:uncharacterized protein LOC127711442 isoform X17 [Mytilus californianus]|uniref:uncharacterized protein LOC127711442 isoform X17 n=1 Tax=Mytilus californianus TaxID=6549 RepID=UPI002245DD66|nr:uncharacterized protein LOC127711442 isoform X17 [Mytilus californianus]